MRIKTNNLNTAQNWPGLSLTSIHQRLELSNLFLIWVSPTTYLTLILVKKTNSWKPIIIVHDHQSTHHLSHSNPQSSPSRTLWKPLSNQKKIENPNWYLRLWRMFETPFRNNQSIKKRGGGRAGKHNKEREDYLTLFYKTSSWYTKKKIRRKKMWREREKDKKKDVLGRRDEVEDQITNKQKKGTLRLLTHTHTHTRINITR